MFTRLRDVASESACRSRVPWPHGGNLYVSHQLTLIRSLPHGHAAAVRAQAKAVGPAGVAGPAGRARDVAMALVVARVVRPASKLATARWWTDTSLAADLGVADASRNETYAALDWLPAGRLADDRAPARWPRAATAGAASGAIRGSNTGCSPTRPAGRRGDARPARRLRPAHWPACLRWTRAAGRPRCHGVWVVSTRVR